MHSSPIVQPALKQNARCSNDAFKSDKLLNVKHPRKRDAAVRVAWKENAIERERERESNFLIFSLHHSAPASTCSVEQTHLSFGQRQSGMFYGLGILPVTVLMWFTSKTVRGNEKSYSFPPLQHSDMIHMRLCTASGRRGGDKNYKNLLDTLT